MPAKSYETLDVLTTEGNATSARFSVELRSYMLIAVTNVIDNMISAMMKRLDVQLLLQEFAVMNSHK